MKLVDILARELKVWPEGLECLSQIKGTGYIINGKGFDGRAFDALQIADETLVAGAIVTRAEWQAAVDALNASEFPQESDWPEGATHYTPPQSADQNGVFYRVEGEKCTFGWPVVGGKARGVGDGGLGERDTSGMRWRIPGTISRPAPKATHSSEWKEGELPPVGVTCEVRSSATGDKWVEVEVIAHFKAPRDVAACVPIHLERKVFQAISDCFRPIITPEKVAAEEREAEDNEIMSRYLSLSDCEKGMLGRSPERVIIGLMRVMGYRKEPKPCGS